MITINEPHITKLNNSHVRLEALVNIDNSEEQLLWFEVDSNYGEYLVDEKADAFLIAVLPYALAFKKDIEVKNSAISESLYWNLTREYIPVMGKYTKYYKFINIKAETTNVSFDSKAVGTGFSAGVDSFYTVLRNYKTNLKNCDLTHLTFFNVGACGYGSEGGEKAYRRFEERSELFEKTIKDLNLKFVKVNSNVGDFKPVNYNWNHSYKSMSAVLALQKLFKRYYYSSGWSLNDFRLDYHDSSYYDLFNAQSFSTESTHIFSVGLWESRLDKVKFISNYPVTYDVLNVCNNHTSNCKECDKCIRTMGELYSIGKLDNYNKVFDANYFKKHLTYYQSRLISKGYDGTIEAAFNKEIIKEMKNNGYRVSPFAYIEAVPRVIWGLCCGIAKKNKYLTKAFRKKNAEKKGLFYSDL